MGLAMSSNETVRCRLREDSLQPVEPRSSLGGSALSRTMLFFLPDFAILHGVWIWFVVFGHDAYDI
jgi:hypothetical protein